MRTTLLRPALALASIAIVVAACSSTGSTAVPPAAAGAGASAAAATAGPGGVITVTDAWARAMPPGTTTSAVYFKLTNLTGQDDALVSVSTPVTATAEIHQVMAVSAAPAESTGMGGGMTSVAPAGGAMMGMSPIDKLPLPAGATVELKPGAYHVMLVDVKDPLKEGTTIEVTLTFEKAPPVTLTVPVQMG
jgi:copper(I)-binding protein